MTTTARFLVLWGTPQDPDFFERHYREIHVPLVKKLPGGRGSPGSGARRNPGPAAYPTGPGTGPWSSSGLSFSQLSA